MPPKPIHHRSPEGAGKGRRARRRGSSAGRRWRWRSAYGPRPEVPLPPSPSPKRHTPRAMNRSGPGRSGQGAATWPLKGPQDFTLFVCRSASWFWVFSDDHRIPSYRWMARAGSPRAHSQWFVNDLRRISPYPSHPPAAPPPRPQDGAGGSGHRPLGPPHQRPPPPRDPSRGHPPPLTPPPLIQVHRSSVAGSKRSRHRRSVGRWGRKPRANGETGVNVYFQNNLPREDKVICS